MSTSPGSHLPTMYECRREKWRAARKTEIFSDSIGLMGVVLGKMKEGESPQETISTEPRKKSALDKILDVLLKNKCIEHVPGRRLI